MYICREEVINLQMAEIEGTISFKSPLTLKGPGFFVYLKSGDLGRGATKNSEIWHICRVGQYERADKISILKIKAFLNYANLCL